MAKCSATESGRKEAERDVGGTGGQKNERTNKNEEYEKEENKTEGSTARSTDFFEGSIWKVTTSGISKD